MDLWKCLILAAIWLWTLKLSYGYGYEEGSRIMEAFMKHKASFYGGYKEEENAG